jgi:amidase
MNLYATAREQLDDLRSKRVSARELLDAYIARNEKLKKTLNAVIDTDLNRAKADAAAIDDARAKGKPLGPLAGLPMTIKDGLDVENMPATSGNPGLSGRPKHCADAVVVHAARKAGAVIWGKTNVPLMLGDFQTYNAVYGTTNNPYDVKRTPGGSSGGAAAALASGITPLEIGSDIGGSLRHPANFCGVCSLKPTWGVLDLRGHVPPAPGAFFETDLGVVGPMARNSEDLKLLWSVLNGSALSARRDVKSTRVAVWDEEPGFPLAREVRDAVTRAADALTLAGARVERAKPDISGGMLMETYTTLLVAILSVDLPDAMADGFEAMREADKKAVETKGEKAAAALYRLRAMASYREVMRAAVRRQATKDKLKEFFDHGWDAILMPISPVTAFKHQHEPGFNERTLYVDGETVPYSTMLNWIAPATALHAPALAVPAGRAPSGLPVGVQVMAPWHGEDRLFDFAAAIEEGLGGFTPPPTLPI